MQMAVGCILQLNGSCTEYSDFESIENCYTGTLIIYYPASCFCTQPLVFAHNVHHPASVLHSICPVMESMHTWESYLCNGEGGMPWQIDTDKPQRLDRVHLIKLMEFTVAPCVGIDLLSV